jgi:membrane-associated phospholipid phosphatase
MTANRALAGLALALVVVGLVFGLWPQLDLAGTGWVHQTFGFIDDSEAARAARDILRLAPFWLLGALAALALLRRFVVKATPAPSWRALAFLIASLIVGSGLIVNFGLKDHSHRPRPVHVREFGGDQEFRPWWRFDGACKRNCSFASGEAASGAWMLAPALLTPPPLQAAAIVGAVIFAVATSALRVAFGGHFLSDVLFGGLISAFVVVAMWRLYARNTASSAAGS